jgi:SnoaL-like domain/Aspartyl protease
MFRKELSCFAAVVLMIGSLLAGGAAWAQGGAGATASGGAEEIPLERCDVLPVVILRIDGAEMRFLVDTGATTMLNIATFSKGRSKDIAVTSWSGTLATSAKEVYLPELVLGSHRLKELRLPAIDLSPIGKACGAKIDGILGADLLDRIGMTIDLKRRVAAFETDSGDAKMRYQQMESGMHQCSDAFESGNVAVLEQCFDPEIVMYSPDGEYRGRKQVIEYLQTRFMKNAPNLVYKMQVKDMKSFGVALWYSYDYTIDTPKEHIAGHGMSMCRRVNGKWNILNLHNSMREAEGVARN